MPYRRTVLAAGLGMAGATAVPAARAQPAACAPRRLEGDDWAAAVQAQEAACSAAPAARGAGAARHLTAVALYDPRVQFGFDSAVLDPMALPTLDRLAAFLLSPAALPRALRIEGHTDAVGMLRYNIRLSERRAESVLLYLVGRGVAEARMDSVGYGPLRPLPQTGGFDAANRRVQFLLGGG
jgi:outer membrane protein OmpA-like peptidoglycan-associated protein